MSSMKLSFSNFLHPGSFICQDCLVKIHPCPVMFIFHPNIMCVFIQTQNRGIGNLHANIANTLFRHACSINILKNISKKYLKYFKKHPFSIIANHFLLYLGLNHYEASMNTQIWCWFQIRQNNLK